MNLLRLVLLTVAVCLATLAQTNAVDAALEGYIRDATGASVAGAKVTIRNPETNVSLDVQSAADGYYRFPILKVGQYDVKVSAAGFKEFVQNGFRLAVGQKGRLDIAMTIGNVAEQVEVNADLPIATASTASIGAVLSRKEVEELPIVSRNVYNYHLLSPGVQGLPSAAFGTTQFTFGGNERTAWNLDGLDNTQRANTRQIRMVITTPEAVEEMQVLANGYTAEFGRAAGGQINVILKSGTNDFHGSALGLYRFQDLQARPSLAALNPDRTWHDEAFTLGGPIKKDRLWFFGQFENNPYTLPNSVSISAANASALGLPPNPTGTIPFGETYRTYVIKTNYKLNDKNFGYVRYNRFTNDQPNNASGLTVQSRGTTFYDRMNGGGAQLITLLTPNLTNELRSGVIQRTTINAPFPGGDPNGAAINITGVANIGFNPLNYTAQTEKAFQLIDSLTWTRGKSTWKTGVDFQRTNFDILRPQNRTFTFGGLAAANGRPAVSALNQYLNTKAGLIDPATGKPYTYTQFAIDGGDPALQISYSFINFFLQNEYRVTPRLTLSAGVRYEAILFPELDPQAPYVLSRRINNDYSNVAPRVSFSYAATKDNKTVVRGAFGLFYDVPGLSIFSTAAQVNGRKFLSYQVNGTDALAPVFPNVPKIDNAALIVPPNINAFPERFRNTYQIQGNLQLQRELARDFLLTLGYNYAAQRQGLYSQNINLGPVTSFLADGRPVYGARAQRPDLRFNQINLIQSGANTNYNALIVNVTKRLSHGLQFSASYTWSHALANNLGIAGSGQDPFNLRRDYGNGDNDVRHYFVVNGLYEPRFSQKPLSWLNGFQLSSTGFYNSGYPINATTGIDLNADGVLNDRPLFRGRNDLKGPSIFQIDARVSRTVKIRDRYRLVFLIEGENILNSLNPNCSTTSGCSGATVSNVNAADFGRITSARTARNIQLGAKFLF